jgi:hypothetical protein
MKWLLDAWNKFWFGIEDTSALNFLRVGLGSILALHYITLIGNLKPLYGVQGLVSVETAKSQGPSLIPVILFYLQSDLFLYLFYSLLIAACVLFAAGWKTHWTKWLVWYGHYCFIKRDPFISGGADRVALSILLLLCLAPLGSITQRVQGKAIGWASACLRLIQIQLCVIYFYSGTKKLEYPGWWSGDALWTAMVDPQYTSNWAAFFARHYWLVNLGCYATLLFEIGYAFLMIQRKARPVILIGALALHLGICLFMGLYYFAFVMIVANLAFVDHKVLAELKQIAGLLAQAFPSRTRKTIY